MLGRGQRPELGLLAQRITNTDRTRQLDEPSEEFPCNIFMQNEPRARDTGLTLVVKDRESGPVDSRSEIRVREHNIRTLAPELELHLLQASGRGCDNLTTDRRRTRKGDLANV